MSEYTNDFELAWAAYPKRNGRKVGKKPAYAQWQKLTAEEKRIAFTDIEKRNRQGTWGKYVKDMQRYLRDHGWDDEIDSPQADMLQPRKQATDSRYEGLQLPWWDRMLKRIGTSYIRTARGLPECDTMIAVKRELEKEIPAVLQDVDGAEDEDERKARLGEAAHTIADLFLCRLDHAYGLELRTRVLRASRKAA